MKLDGCYAALVMEQQITHGYFSHKKDSGRLTKDTNKIVELDAQYSLDIYDSTITLRKFSF